MSALEDAITNDHDMKDLFAHETNTPTLVKVEDLPSHLQIKRARFIKKLMCDCDIEMEYPPIGSAAPQPDVDENRT